MGHNKKPAGAATPTGRESKPESFLISTDSSKPDSTTCVGLATKPDKETRFTPEQLERARQRRAKWREYRRRNPGAYEYAEGLALRKMAAGQRLGGTELIESIRAHAFTDIDGNPTRTDNSFAPLIVRDLCEDHPGMRGFVEFRTSIYDVLDEW